MFNLAPLLLIFPLVGAIINGVAGNRFVADNRHNGERWVGWLASGMALATFGVTLLLLFALRADPSGALVRLFDWIVIPNTNYNIPWELQIDTLSVAMLLVITGVGSLIHIYAIGYMHGDESFARFFSYLNLFLFFMILLVTGSSYLVLFVGWEGVGLASFLLIGFWFSKKRVIVDGDRGEKLYEGVVNSNAARKAFVVNRVGDLCMIMAMSLLFWAFGSLQFADVFPAAVEVFEHGGQVMIAGREYGVEAVLTAVTFLLLLGAAGKSAQLPLFIWLPDAMAGPTPVSALMHAATMVTSGIYLIVRSNVLYEIVRESGYQMLGIISSPDLVALIGALTAVWAGLIAFTQFDIKKVLAYSTVSQLGFMIAAAGMGAYVAAMFHLMTHAFFKALLFMGAGSVIHGMEHGEHHLHAAHGDHHDAESPHDESHDVAQRHAGLQFDPQDMRFMGDLRKRMPITSVVYIFGALALAGIVPFAGFWSKDEILAHASYNMSHGGGAIYTTVYILLSIAAVCTAFYMGRQLKMTFFGKARHAAAEHAEESPQVMTRPLVILAALSLLGGALNIPYFSEAAAPAHGETAAVVADAHVDEDDHATEEAHAAEEESHGEEVVHAEQGDHGDEAHALSGGGRLVLEHWLEPSLAAFELTEEGIVHLPFTPTWIQPTVAIVSTVLAVAALAASFMFVYRDKPRTVDDPDPIFNVPPFPQMARLPLNALYMKGLMPLFNRLARFLAFRVDWDFYHDTFHNSGVRDSFIRFARFTNDVLDSRVVDNGLVLGTGRMIRGVSNAFKQVQTGFVRNYALGLFLGVVVLVVYFVLMT